MIKIKKVTDFKELYAFHMKRKAPYILETNFESYMVSLCEDTDSYGNKLFKELSLVGAYSDDKLVGFVQFGKTNIGFDDVGEITTDVSYNVIRNLYFEDTIVGEKLLKIALSELKKDVFAFFHYFGMSCFGRHGKLSEHESNVEEILAKEGFVPNEVNVYYSSKIIKEDAEIDLEVSDVSKNNVQHIAFKDNEELIGEAEIHYVNSQTVYLRWIYVCDNKRHLGYGSKCMKKLKTYLYNLGILRLDTDTDLYNVTAQTYYERNNFVNLGKTKSYIRKRVIIKK